MPLQPIGGRTGRLQQPEFTGENRCLPCTAVNFGLAAGTAGVVALVSPPAALAVAAGALASIYYRGYFVPGTPELTRRYLPERVLDAFGKSPEPIPAGEVDPAVVLIGAGVLVDEPGAPDTSLHPAFADAWEARSTDLLRDGQASALDTLANLTGVPSDDLRIASIGNADAIAVFFGDERLGTWESAVAFCVDVAGMELLAESVEDWVRFGLDVRSELAGTLRLFVEHCPDCGGAVTLDEATVSYCCSTRDVVAVSCTNCAVRLLELPVAVDELRTQADGP